MKISKYFLSLVTLTISASLWGQSTDATYIADSAIMYIESGTNTSIFGDLEVDGNFRSRDKGIAPRVELFGENIILDSNTADMRALPLGNSGAIFAFGASLNQKLMGGSKNQSDTNSYFPNVELNNSSNLDLVQSHGGCTGTFKFLSGKVLHNYQDFTIGGPSHSGQIQGYDQSKYFVTNGSYNPEAYGYLHRYSALNTDVDYPLGPDLNHYEPARLMTAINPTQFRTRVFHGVSAYGFDDTLVTSRSCGFTWDLVPSGATMPTTNITLAHTIANEGPFYSAAPDADEYITHYVGYAPNFDGGIKSNTNWDRLINGSPIQAMDIHDGSVNTGAYKQHIRFAQNSFSPFSKAINSSLYPLDLKEVVLRAINENNEYARLHWEINNESNIDHYTVSKSLDAGTSFVLMPDKQTAAQNLPEYELEDHDVVLGRTYYYIVTAHDLDKGKDYPSNVAMVQFLGSGRSIVLYPNPAKNHISVNYKNGQASDVRVQLLTSLGQLLETRRVYSQTGNTTISFDVSALADGNYVMYIKDDSGKGAESIKFQILRQ